MIKHLVAYDPLTPQPEAGERNGEGHEWVMAHHGSPAPLHVPTYRCSLKLIPRVNFTLQLTICHTRCGLNLPRPPRKISESACVCVCPREEGIYRLCGANT